MSENIEIKETEINADDLMAEFDRESNTRRFTGWRSVIIKVLFIAFAVFCCLSPFASLPPISLAMIRLASNINSSIRWLALVE